MYYHNTYIKGISQELGFAYQTDQLDLSLVDERGNSAEEIKIYIMPLADERNKSSHLQVEVQI